jgi:16S rRNA (guanine966-N2)-methyltransferase
VRPTSDRVREAVFDMLFSQGGVDGLRVADLFAGSGAMGIEALSRGASSVTFVDLDTRCREVIRENLAAVGMGEAERDGEATLVRADVLDWVRSTVARYDVALCDPPYDFDGWEPLLALLPADLAVLESRVEPPAVDGWGVLRSRRYGGTIVTVLRQDRDIQKGAS